MVTLRGNAVNRLKRLNRDVFRTCRFSRLCNYKHSIVLIFSNLGVNIPVPFDFLLNSADFDVKWPGNPKILVVISPSG